MSAFTDALRARYVARESETDGFGRKIEVGRLRPGAALRVRAIIGSDVPGVVTEALVAAGVTAIINPDGKRLDLFPPQTAGALSAILDTLDAEGMNAAVLAYGRLEGVEPEQGEKPPGDAAGVTDGAAQTIEGHVTITAEIPAPAPEPPAP